MKVFFVGHAGAGKTSLIEGLMKHDRGGDSPGIHSSSIPVDDPTFLYGYPKQGQAGVVHQPEFYDWAPRVPRTPSTMARAGNPERLRPALGGGNWGTPVSQPFWAGRRWGANSLGRDEAEAEGFRQRGESTGSNFEIGIKVWTPSPSRTPSVRVSGGEGGSGRKRIPGSSGGYMEGTDGNGDGAGDAPSGTARNSGDITLKLWDFGGTEEFHAVHGLFFSGCVDGTESVRLDES